MSSEEEKPESRPVDPPDAFSVLGTYQTAREAHEAGLSILAAGKHYWVHFSEGRYLLVVRSAHEAELRKEVEIASFLNRYWPPRALELPVKSVSKLPTAATIAIVVLFFWLQNRNPHIKELGLNSGDAVLNQGEWWRIVTATMLHADLGHLAGNILGLSLFGYLAARYFGNGLSWVMVIVAAACSNLTSVLLNDAATYRSLGASTAVFSALGLLAGFPIGAYLRSRTPIQQRDWLIPFFGGCILFAWMGGGEFPTDVGAHLWSFAYGTCFASLAAATALHAKLKQRSQQILLLALIILVTASWTWALLS